MIFKKRRFQWLHLVVVMAVPMATILSFVNISTMFFRLLDSSSSSNRVDVRQSTAEHSSSTSLPPSPPRSLSAPRSINNNDKFKTCMRQQRYKTTTNIDASSSSTSSPSSTLPLLLPLPSRTKNETMTLHDAFASNTTTIYFLHQRKAAGSAIREILYYKYQDIVGSEEAKRRSFVPCITHPSQTYELPLIDSNSLGEIKLIAAHMSYHVPFARAMFDGGDDDDDDSSSVGSQHQSVFITNFREPLSRIKSCMFYRYPEKVHQLLMAKNFTIESIEHLFMTEKDDKEERTCVQEPFRILSPFNPDKEPVSDHHINQVCCYVKTYFHVINQFQKRPKKRKKKRKMTSGRQGSEVENVVATTIALDDVDTPSSTLRRRTAIEQELLSALNNTTTIINKTPYIYGQMNQVEEQRWIQFTAHLRRTNSFVQAEQKLYDCIFE